MRQISIAKVWTDTTHVHALTTEGVEASYAFSDWPRLANATDGQRRDFRLSFSGIHWPQINEDLCFEGMFRDNNVLVEDTQIVWKQGNRQMSEQ
ncbi:MAG: DUF2442 domain-containing protein [Prevotella sp.]|nr:DUF2442 domain-containing protein [Prevotella sp.]